MYEAVLNTGKNLYTYYEKTNHSRINRICIDGRVTGCGKCVGYCQYSGHPGFLTTELRKQHDCINKNCYHYVPKPSKKKARIENKSSVYLYEIGCALRAYEGMKVLGVDETDKGLILRYITITNSYSLEEISGLLATKLGCRIMWKRLNYSFDVCVKLLFA